MVQNIGFAPIQSVVEFPEKQQLQNVGNIIVLAFILSLTIIVLMNVVTIKKLRTVFTVLKLVDIEKTSEIIKEEKERSAKTLQTHRVVSLIKRNRFFNYKVKNRNTLETS